MRRDPAKSEVHYELPLGLPGSPSLDPVAQA